MTTGLLPTGLSIKRYEDIVTELQTFYASLYGNPNLDPKSVIGRRIAAQAQQLTQIWELIQLIYNAPFIALADEGSIDNTLANEGITRKAAEPTTLTKVNCVFSKAATIPAGSLITDSNGDQFAAASDIVATGAQTNTDCTFICTATGPIVVPGTDTLSIVTPIDGWTSAVLSTSSAEDSTGTVGRDIETPAEARLRYASSVAINGAGTIPALYAALNDISGVTAQIIENDTDVYDGANFMDPHSISIIVSGTWSTAEKNAIAAVIWDKRGGGIKLNGTTSVTIVDSNGDNQVMNFSYVIDNPIAVDVHYSWFTEETPPVNTNDVIEAIVESFFDLMKPGLDVINSKLTGQIAQIPGIKTPIVTFDAYAGDISIPITQRATQGTTLIHAPS